MVSKATSTNHMITVRHTKPTTWAKCATAATRPGVLLLSGVSVVGKPSAAGLQSSAPQTDVDGA